MTWWLGSREDGISGARKISARGATGTDGWTGEEVLARVEARHRAMTGDAAEKAEQAAYLKRFTELRKTLKPTNDPGKTAREALAANREIDDLAWHISHREELAITGVRMMQWMEVDPGGMRDFLIDWKSEELEDAPYLIGWRPGSVAVDTPLRTWGDETPPEVVKGWLDGALSSWAHRWNRMNPLSEQPVSGFVPGIYSPVIEGLVRRPAAAGDAPELLAMVKSLPFNSGCHAAVAAWPQDRLMELKDEASRRHDSFIVQEIRERMPDETSGQPGDAFLQLPQREMKAIAADTSLTPEERTAKLVEIAMSHRFRKDMAEEKAKNYLLDAKAEETPDDSGTREAIAAFREGTMTPHDTQLRLSAVATDHASASSWDVAWREMRQMIQTDTPRALAIFDDASTLARTRDMAVSKSYHRYGAEFIPEVLKMAPGKARNDVLSSLAAEVGKIDPQQAMSLRNQIEAEEGSK